MAKNCCLHIGLPVAMATALVFSAGCGGLGGGGGGDGTSDTITPTVVSVSPASFATDVFTTSTITVTFSEAMSQTTAQGAFSISPSVAGAFSWNMNTMTFDPTGTLINNLHYTCTMSTAATDSAGNALTSQYQWGFTAVPLTPTLVGSYPPFEGGSAWGVHVAGSYAYVADRTFGLIFMDISAPATPLVAGFTAEMFQANTVYVAGNYAYATDGNQNLRIFDIADKEAPIQKSSTRYDWTPLDLSVVGNYAYVAYNGGLEIIDISDPVNPSLAGSCITSSDNGQVFVSGGYAYVADGDLGGVLNIIDITDPTKPTLAGSYTPLGEDYEGSAASDVFVVGNYAYVPDGYGKLEIVDISTPASPTLVSSCDVMGFAHYVHVIGSYAYVLDGGGNMSLINISDPAAPFMAGSCDITVGAGISVSGSYAYIASGNLGLQIFGGIGQ